MEDDRTPSEPEANSSTLQDELDQEFYTALRAAGASPEEAQSCVRTDATPLAR